MLLPTENFKNVGFLIFAILICTFSCCGNNTKTKKEQGKDPLAAADLPSTLRTAGGETLRVVDLAHHLGLDLDTKTWTARAYDIDGDGDKDLFIGRHAQGPALLYRNDHGSYSLIDDHTFLSHVDGHDCAFADVNHDGKIDLYCSIGAGKGTKSKQNQLWIQQSNSSYLNEADEYGVADSLGRGRHVLFLDVNHDVYPDLFVGNDAPRPDGQPTPNRLFINEAGKKFRDSPEYGVNEEVGEFCARSFDFNQDGWDDLLVCGQGKPPLPLLLYENHAGKEFRNVSIKVGLSNAFYTDALALDLNHDNRIDLALIRQDLVVVQLQGPDGIFKPPITLLKHLTNGVKLAAGDIDGDGDEDLYVLQGCIKKDRTDYPDGILLNDGTGVRYVTLKVPQPVRGCGDTVIALDADDRGRTPFLVLNGKDVSGNVQVIALEGGNP